MRTLHLVSHTHWDREWYLTFQQFRLKLVHLIDGLLDILETDPEYRYFMLDGQTVVLDDYLAMRPEREEMLRRFITSGRIVIGPWHILPDEFLVSPEATIRNLLQGGRTARRFGPKMHVGYIPDPFGHIGQMPQILNGFGIRQAAFRRGLADEPCEVWWQSPDGSQVLTAYLRDGYDNAAGLPVADLPRFVSEVRRLRDNLLPHAAATHLLLLQGTDHMEPPAGTPAAIAFAAGKLDGDLLVHSTLADYLQAMQASVEAGRLPVVLGELRQSKRHHLLPGVLSTRMWIKQRNRACETLLEKWVEPFTAFAALASEGAPEVTHLNRTAEIARSAWRLLMENHPHDSICGCSIDQVHEEMRVRFDQVDQIGEELTRQSLETLAGVISTRVDQIQRINDSESIEAAVVVFNPTLAPRTDLAEAAVELPPAVSAFELVDENGASIPYQTRGLGSREIIHMSLDPKGLQLTLGGINEGRAAGMGIQAMSIRRDGAQVFIDVVMDEGREPNLAVWRDGLEQVNACLADPGVTLYDVRARTSAAVQLAFSAADVPGLGWRTFWVRALDRPSRAMQLNTLARTLMPLGAKLAGSRLGKSLLARLSRDPAGKPPFKIENEFIRVEARRDGTLSLLDKRSGAAFHGLNRFLDGGDCGDEYDYAPPPTDLLAGARLKSIRVRRGPVQQRLELHLELRLPAGLSPDRKSRSPRTVAVPVKTQATLARGVTRLDIHTELENNARDHRLRVHFPVPFLPEAGDHDGHFEVVQRPIGVPAFDESWVEQPRPEVPQRAFTDVSDGQLGLMVANRGLPEVEVLKNADGNGEIALTLLRCVGWLSRDDFSTRKGHAGPMIATPAAQMPGSQSFDYAVIPHAGDWKNAFQEAYAFEAPLRAAVTGIHQGSLAPAGAFVAVEPQTFAISAVKEAETGDGWLVRGYNLTGETKEVTLKPWRRFRSAALADLAEEAKSELRLADDGSVTFQAGGHQIVTVLFKE